MPTLTMSRKGQLTVPRALREQLKLRPGCQVDMRVDSEGRLILTPILDEPEDFLARRPPAPGCVASIEEMRQASGRGQFVVAFDTNVVVRLLFRDDAAQAKAEHAFLRHARDNL